MLKKIKDLEKFGVEKTTTQDKSDGVFVLVDDEIITKKEEGDTDGERD